MNFSSPGQGQVPIIRGAVDAIKRCAAGWFVHAWRFGCRPSAIAGPRTFTQARIIIESCIERHVIAKSGLHAPQQRHQYGPKGPASRKRCRRSAPPGIAGAPSFPSVMLSTPLMASTAKSCAGLRRYGPFLAERADRTIDDAGIARLHPLIVHAETRYDARAEAFDEDVGRFTQLEQYSRSLSCLRSRTILFLPRFTLRKKTVLSPSSDPIDRPCRRRALRP